MKKIIYILSIVLVSCSKKDAVTETTPTTASFKIIDHKNEWCACQSYVRRMTYEIYYDTTGVRYFDVTNSLRTQGVSLRLFNSDPQGIIEANDFATCQYPGECDVTYTAKIVYRNGTEIELPKIKL